MNTKIIEEDNEIELNDDELEFENNEVQDIEAIDRTKLTLQDFFNDMILFNKQLQDKSIVKPKFNFGDLNVTNYLLWLLLGELTIINDKLIGKE